MLLGIARKVVPIRYRQSIGLWTAAQACRSKLLLYPYFVLLCGNIPRGIRLMTDGRCSVLYKGVEIVAPWDGILAFIEVLQDEVYELFYRPKQGDTVLDIGAYVGMFTIKASLQVGDDGSVIAVEPATSNLAFLRQNTRLLKNVKVVPVAVGDDGHLGRLSLSRASPCHSLSLNGSGEAETVEVEAIDHIVSRLGIGKVDFIKIDAEGSELEILRGAKRTLRENKVHVAVASYHNLPSGEKELPYVCHELTEAGLSIRVVKGYVYGSNYE